MTRRYSMKVRRDTGYLKPKKFQDYMTLSEVASAVERDPSWIRLLEANDRIPKATRIKRGQLQIRLWSPAQVDEIRAIIATHRPGRPQA
jgi:hypothetical protein